MDKNEVRHKLHDEICALDTAIKQLASIRPYVDSSSKQDRFDRSLAIIIGVKNDMLKTLTELKNDMTKQSQSDVIVDTFRKNFEAMSYAEREEYLKKHGFDFGSSESDVIVDTFRKKFEAMSYEEREEYLKEHGFDFGSSDEITH